MAVSNVGYYANAYEYTYYADRAKETDRDKKNRAEGEKGTSAVQSGTEGKGAMAVQKNTGRTEGNASYLRKLQAGRTHVTLEEGSMLSLRRDNKVGTVTINPKLLEKMQNDPEAEKKYTQLIKDIERAEKTVGAYYDALGGCVEHTSHWYIDENGEYTHFGYVRRDDKLNKKLRKDAQDNAKKRMERTREKAREKTEQLEQKLAEKAAKAQEEEKAQEEALQDKDKTKTEKLLDSKTENADSGEVYFDEGDMQAIIQAVKEEPPSARKQDCPVPSAGSNFDITIG